jgi:hypothetical protein
MTKFVAGDRVKIAEFCGWGPFVGEVLMADDEQVEVLCDSEDGNKHFNTVYSENFHLLSHAK